MNAVIRTIRVVAATLILANAAAAQEVVVRNDSVEDFGAATLFGDFAVGEEAASWLTSPCDGRLVAVQVIWFSALPGAQPTLEENIWVYAGGSFPTPGGVILQLEGPILTPGVNNEFRTIDEGGSPIDVPVRTGETFVVSLEFGNATDIAAGTPSLLRDNDGCQGGRNALFAPGLGGWLNFCIFLQGDIAIRAVVECGVPSGACCLVTGLCQDDVSESVCSGIDGEFQGANTDCEFIECPDPTEACCFMPNGCVDLTVAECEAARGERQGPGTTCQITECFATGACCLASGDCVNDIPADVCTAAGGSPQGTDTFCDDLVCPQPDAACCLANGNCLFITNAECDVIPNAVWSGFGTDCSDGDSNGTADACESACNDPPQDIDADCDVDLLDAMKFQACYTGPDVAPAPECQCFDTDRDNDIDLTDYAAFTLSTTGPAAGCP